MTQAGLLSVNIMVWKLYQTTNFRLVRIEGICRQQELLLEYEKVSWEMPEMTFSFFALSYLNSELFDNGSYSWGTYQLSISYDLPPRSELLISCSTG